MMDAPLTRLILLGIMGVLASLAPAAGSRVQFRAGVDAVEVYASVTDASGEPITDLIGSDFRILEDGEPQVLTTFSAGEFPLAVALAIDRSWSVGADRLRLTTQAASRFLGQLRPDDQAMIIGIGTTVDVLAPLSRDRDAQRTAIDAIDRWGTTSLHDAIIASIDLMQSGEGRRAVILVSDGDDRYSRASAAEALTHARASDVLIYPLAVGKRWPPLFAELAVLTGGRSAHVANESTIETTLLAIARELRHQYFLGYEPSRPMPAAGTEWRAIRVSVVRPGAKVRARDGYLAR